MSVTAWTRGAGTACKVPWLPGCLPVSSCYPPGPAGLQPAALTPRPSCLSQDGQSRTVRQFQFTDWPEQGVPKTGEGFIDFIGQVHKTKEQFGQDGPITVHCRWDLPLEGWAGAGVAYRPGGLGP